MPANILDIQANRLVAKQVRLQLRIANVTQIEIATAIGRSKSTIGLRLDSKRSFTAPELIRIADHLGIEVADLFPKESAS